MFIRKMLWLRELCSFMSKEQSDDRMRGGGRKGETLIQTSYLKCHSFFFPNRVVKQDVHITHFSPLHLIMVLLYQWKMSDMTPLTVWVSEHQEDQQRDSLVTATWRLAFPSSITSITSSGLVTKRSVQPLVRDRHTHTFILHIINGQIYLSHSSTTH